MADRFPWENKSSPGKAQSCVYTIQNIALGKNNNNNSNKNQTDPETYCITSRMLEGHLQHVHRVSRSEDLFDVMYPTLVFTWAVIDDLRKSRDCTR